MIPEDRREVTLVYYDAREVSFQDVGMAPRMLDAIREAARADGIDSVENLSDVLTGSPAGGSASGSVWMPGSGPRRATRPSAVS